MSRFGYCLLLALFVLSLRDVFSREHNEDEHDESDFKNEFGDEKGYSEGSESEHIELREQSHFTKPQHIVSIKNLPPVNFQFCVSCGYRQAFEQYSQVIREKYPNIEISGENYPTALWKTYLAQFIGIFKMVLIVSIVSGSNPFEKLGLGYPSLLQWAHGNKLSACMMSFLLSNMIESALLSSGAFEIYLGKELLWSKLESGRVPAPNELIQIIDNNLELQGLIPASAGTLSSGFNQP